MAATQRDGRKNVGEKKTYLQQRALTYEKNSVKRLDSGLRIVPNAKRSIGLLSNTMAHPDALSALMALYQLMVRSIGVQTRTAVCGLSSVDCKLSMRGQNCKSRTGKQLKEPNVLDCWTL